MDDLFMDATVSAGFLRTCRVTHVVRFHGHHDGVHRRHHRYHWSQSPRTCRREIRATHPGSRFGWRDELLPRSLRNDHTRHHIRAEQRRSVSFSMRFSVRRIRLLWVALCNRHCREICSHHLDNSQLCPGRHDYFPLHGGSGLRHSCAQLWRRTEQAESVYRYYGHRSWNGSHSRPCLGQYYWTGCISLWRKFLAGESRLVSKLPRYEILHHVSSLILWGCDSVSHIPCLFRFINGWFSGALIWVWNFMCLGFRDSLIIVLTNGFSIGGLIAMVLNLLLPFDKDDAHVG